MSSISTDLSSPQWWISVVVVGIGIHLAAGYLKPRLDRLFEKGSGWRAGRTAKRREERLARVCILRKITDTEAHIREIRHRTRGLMILTISGIVFALSLWLVDRLERTPEQWALLVVLLISALFLAFGLREFDAGERMESELREARDTEDTKD